MQFLVVAHDGTDSMAMERRMKARPSHLELGDELLANGHLWYAAALTGENGEMIGSMYMVDFESKKEFDDWLSKEPYVIGDVWRKIEVFPCNTRNPWQFNRPKEFFEARGK